MDQFGANMGPAVTLPAGTEFTVTIPKLHRPSDSFEMVWCEIRVSSQLYRVPLKTLETSRAA